MSFPAHGVTPPTLAAWQLNFGGLNFGGVDLTSDIYPLLAVPSGLDLPPVRSGDATRPRDHGGFVGLDLLGERSITVDLAVRANPLSALPSARDAAIATSRRALAAALAPSPIVETPLWIADAGGTVFACLARARKAAWPVDIMLVGARALKAAVQFVASDPRLYATPTTRTSLAIGASATLTHAGNVEMRPLLAINGPVTRPAIANTSLPGSPTLTFADPGGSGDVLVGDSLLVDLDMHTVRYFNHLTGLTTNVANWIVTGSVWWNLVPGANVLSFAASAGTGSLDVDWASAYLTI